MAQTSTSQILDVQKTKAVLANIQDEALVSQVCENLGIHPNQYFLKSKLIKNTDEEKMKKEAYNNSVPITRHRTGENLFENANPKFSRIQKTMERTTVNFSTWGVSFIS